MALFPRKKRGEPTEPYDAPENAPVRPPRRVGDLLRETRLGHGGSLEQIGATLRIRTAYLAAIEESHYDQLPGAAYAVGFVRSYAEHLGLDGAEIVRRYKAESQLGEAADLSFPMPVAERGKPGAAILLVALIVAACGYATWYYLSSGERTRPERVAEVPAQLRPPPPPPPLPVPEPPPLLAAPPSQPEPPAAIPAPPAPSSPSSFPAQAAVPPPPVPPAPMTPAAPSMSAPAAPPAAVAMMPPPVAPPTAPAATPGVPEVPPAASAPEAPRVYGVTNGPARIVIKANNESWIQVREGENVLSVRTLKPGESYRVPDRPGLRLRTGNAGGLDISVDGKTVPPIGPSGKSRTAALDPDRLVAGRAVEF